MNCNEARENLELLVLGGLDPSPRAAVEAHVAQCAFCQADADHCRELVLSISRAHDADGAAPADALERAVRDAAAAEIARLRRGRRRILAAGGSLAAAAAIALAAWGLAHTWSSGGRSDRAARPAGPEGPPPSHEALRAYGGSRTLAASQADGVAVLEQTIYLRRGEADGANVAAVDTVTGQTKWRGRFATRGYLAADRHRVYCLADGPAGTLDLVALDAADGDELWRYPQERPRRLDTPCRPVTLGGKGVCWVHGQSVHMLDAASGRTVWTRTVPGPGPLSGLVADETSLYVATAGALHCLDRRRGTNTWTEQLPPHLAGQHKPLIALAGGRLYVIQSRRDGPSRLFCMRLGTRSMLWHRTVPPTRSLLAAAQGVYLRGARVIALGSASGEPLWSRPAAGCGPLTLIDGRIHFVDAADEGRLIALDSATGTEAWEVPGIRSCGAFTKIGRTGYVRTRQGVLRAINR